MSGPVTHPRIERRREALELKLEEAYELYDAFEEAGDTEGENRVGALIDRLEAKLEALDLDATDPEAHGYRW